MDTSDGKVNLVVFDVGEEMGNPALFCHSDEENNCWSYGWDEEKKCFTKKNIGKFVKLH